MRRRDFFTLIGGAVTAWPLAGHTQTAEPVRRIGMLQPCFTCRQLNELDCRDHYPQQSAALVCANPSSESRRLANTERRFSAATQATFSPPKSLRCT